MVGWCIGLTITFIFLTTIVVVAASMNSSRISQGEPLSEVPVNGAEFETKYGKD